MQNRIFYVFMLILLSPALSIAQVDSITIFGILMDTSSVNSNSVVLNLNGLEGKSLNYSSKITKNKFSIRVPKQDIPVYGFLRVYSKEKGMNVMLSPLPIFIGEDDIEVYGDAEDVYFARVIGGEENNEFNILRLSTAADEKQIKSLYKSITEGKVLENSLEAKRIKDEAATLSKKISEVEKSFVIAHPSSYVSLYLLRMNKNQYTAHDYAERFTALSMQYKETKMAKEISAMIAKEAVTRKGTQAFNFERTTLEGKPFSLANEKGRIILLDFWGSWCGPCRASMPHLKDLYTKYKDKGFNIVGIAQERGKTLEESKESWKKAIDQLGIQWTNVLNQENQEQMDIVKAYNISAFPTKILLDEDGKVLIRVVSSATDDMDIYLKEKYGY